MLFSHAMVLASGAALVAAAPAPALIQIGEDDVILHGKGRFAIMKRSELEAFQALRDSDVAPPQPGALNDSFITYTGDEIKNLPPSNLNKRADTIIIPGEPSDFLGWDVQMSAVVKGAPTTLSVTSGYSIGNSVSVSTGVSVNLVKDFLSASMSIDYSQTWTTSTTQAFTADVPAGKYGAFVSNANTHREVGKVWQGTIGGEGTVSDYQADSFKNKNYSGMEWVDGVISLCTGDTFPLKRCIGSGTL